MVTVIELFPPKSGGTVSSVIFSLDVGVEVIDLSEPIQMCIPAAAPPPGEESRCSFWDEAADDGRGDWSSDGCRTMGSCDTGEVMCACDHHTSFAVLNVDAEEQTSGPPPYFTLNLAAIIVPVIVVVLVVLAVAGAAIVYVLYSRKRRRGRAYISEQAGEEEEGIQGNVYVATAF